LDADGPFKKLQSQILSTAEKIVTIKLKNAKKCVLKSPAQMAFWTFIGTFSKVADFTTFEAYD
jgi:hypothetical protein